MASKIRLDIVTPERIVYSEDVDMVIARATDGDIGILPGHAPLIAGLATWPLRVQRDQSESQVALFGGFIEVGPEKVTILASCAELPGEIDVKRAEAAKTRAESRLKEVAPDIDMERAEAALRRALVRLRVSEQLRIRE